VLRACAKTLLFEELAGFSSIEAQLARCPHTECADD
jgi:hypothetical protein